MIYMIEKFICSDPSGQKHLYYYVNNEDVIVCSEIKPISNILENSDFDNKSLVSNLILGYPINSSTLLKNIFRVLPGEQVVIDKKIFKSLFEQSKK